MKNQKNGETRATADERPEKESIDELAQRVHERICATYTNDAPDIVGRLDTLVSRLAANVRAESGATSYASPSDDDLQRAFYCLSPQQQEFLSLQITRGLNSQKIAKLKGLPHAVVQKAIVDGYVRLRQECASALKADDEPKDS